MYIPGPLPLHQDGEGRPSWVGTRYIGSAL